MAKKKRRTKNTKSSSKNKNHQPIQIKLKPKNDSTETCNNLNSEDTQQLKCLICARKINSSIAVVPFDEVFTFQILCQLFKILKISPAVCRFLLADSLSHVKVQFCEFCDKTITHCLTVSQEIDKLRNVLEESTIKIKEDIIEGYYCRPGPDLSQRTNFNIRKTLVQCWTTCQVKVKRLPPSIFESHRNVKTKRNKPAFSSVKQELCDANEKYVTEGPSSPSPNDIVVEPQPPRNFVETECNTADNDFDSDDVESPCSPIAPSPFVSDDSDTEKIDDPLKKDVLSEAPCFPLPLTLSDGSDTERVDDLSNKKEAVANANTEKDGSPNVRRSARNLLLSAKKIPMYCIEIESDENASERGSVYSPDSPCNDEEQEINEPDTKSFKRVRSSAFISRRNSRKVQRRRQRGRGCPKMQIGEPKEPEGQLLESFLCTYCNKFYCRKDFKINTETETDAGTEGDVLSIKCDDLLNCEEQFSDFYQFSVHHSITCTDKLRLIAENPANNKGRLGWVGTYSNSKHINETTGIAPDPSTNTATITVKTGLHKCTVCPRRFKNLDSLAAHEKRHSGRGDISCPQCDLKFTTMFLTRSHQIRVHGQPTKSTYDAENELDSFECVWCNQSFLRSSYMVNESEENSSANGDHPTSSTSPPKQFLRIPIEKTFKKKTSVSFVTNFKTFLWVHRRYCSMRPAIQIREGCLEKQSGVVWENPRKLPKPKSETRYDCGECGKSYIQKGNYQAHYRSHRQDFKHNCPECHEHFGTEIGLARHIYSMHTPKSEGKDNLSNFYQCVRCEKQIDVQFETTAEGESLAPCVFSDCQSKSSTVYHHRVHHAGHHYDPNRAKTKYSCNFCKKSYSPDEASVTGSDGVVRFQCTSDECKRLSKNFILWGRHHRLHHHLKSGKPIDSNKFDPETHICKICNKKFSRAKSCANHVIAKHTKEFPFYCEVCGEGLATNSKLREHMVQHSTDRPFKCEKCPKTFKDNSQLRSHMNFHNNIFPYVCEVCGKAFYRGNNMRMHLKMHKDRT